MSEHFCQRLGWAVAVIAAWAASGAAWGQEGQTAASGHRTIRRARQAQQGADPLTFDDIRAQFEQQDREIQQLKAQLAAAQQGPSAATAPYAGPVGADAAAAAPAGSAPCPKQVGSDLSGIAFFKDGEFLNFSTPNKDFTMHLGGWVQYDNIWWSQSPALDQSPREPPPEALPKAQELRPVLPAAASAPFLTAIPGGGCASSRKAPSGKPAIYRFNWAFENNQLDTTGLDEMWIGYNKHSRGRHHPSSATKRPRWVSKAI